MGTCATRSATEELEDLRTKVDTLEEENAKVWVELRDLREWIARTYGIEPRE